MLIYALVCPTALMHLHMHPFTSFILPSRVSLPQPTSCLEPDLNIIYDCTFPSPESPLSPIGGWASMCSPCVMHYFSSRHGELSLCLTDCIACWSLPRNSMQPSCNLPQLGAAQACFTELTVSFPFMNIRICTPMRISSFFSTCANSRVKSINILHQCGMRSCSWSMRKHENSPRCMVQIF